MARTRAAAAKLTSTEPVNANQEVESLATEEHTEAEASESPIHSEETENMPPKTFNGKLQQFGFTSSIKASVGTAAVGSLPA